MYSGDANYAGSTSSCELFVVAEGSAAAATTVFDAATNTAWAGTEKTGASAFDTATVTGAGGVTPTGTVTYTFFTNATCNGTGTTAGTVALTGGGAVPNSNIRGPLAVGGYAFRAVYSGDVNYAGSTSSCELFVVAQGSVAAATTVFDAATNTAWAGTEKTGASAFDTATVTGAGRGDADGNGDLHVFYQRHLQRDRDNGGHGCPDRRWGGAQCEHPRSAGRWWRCVPGRVFR